MEDSNQLTGIKKRQQIRTANKAVFAWIVAASIVVGVCGVVSEFFVRELLFNNKIFGTLNQTNANLEKSIQAYDGLKSEVTKLVADVNLNALKKGNGSTALQVVIDALPTEENRAAFATSMQNEILGPSGAVVKSLTVISNDTASITASSPGINVGSFGFSFSLSGTYAQITQAIRNMERSIRPIAIQSIDLQGTDSNMEASITAVTYYQEAKSIPIKEVKVSP